MRFEDVWTLDPRDQVAFTPISTDVHHGEFESAAYDPANDRLLVRARANTVALPLGDPVAWTLLGSAPFQFPIRDRYFDGVSLLIEDPQLDALLVLDQVSEADCGVVTRRVREHLAELGANEPAKFVMPAPSDLRYNWLEARLDAIDDEEMQEIVLDAWRMVVPKRVAAEFLGD